MRMRAIEKAVRVTSTEASKSLHTMKHAAAALDKKGNILGLSSNKPNLNVKSIINPRSSIHAEVGAYYAVPPKFRSNIYIIVVVRMGCDGTLRLSKPCERCAEFINSKKIDVYHS